MTRTQTMAIVGASLAGAKAAQGARESGYEGRIVLIGEEPEPPYERPPLSKDLLRGNSDLDGAKVNADDFYEMEGIELVVDRVTSLNVSPRTLALASGDAIGFDTAVIATGALPRRLHTPGMSLAGVHYLRTITDAIRLRDAIGRATRIAIIGAGWIGCEVAASARQMGVDVVLIDPLRVPLQGVLGDRLGEVFRDLHADNGVELRLGAAVQRLRGTSSVEAVVLDDGRIEHADVVVVGIGVAPRTEFLKTTPPIRVDDGVVVDECLATDVDGVFAAGDVANAWHPRYQRHVRVGHWANALNQGLVAGRNAVGRKETYSRLPYFFSDQYDLGLEYVGLAQPHDEVVIRGETATREFIAFWHRQGRVTAAMNVNIWDVVDDLKALIVSDQEVNLARLTDPDTALDDVRS